MYVVFKHNPGSWETNHAIPVYDTQDQGAVTIDKLFSLAPQRPENQTHVKLTRRRRLLDVVLLNGRIGIAALSLQLLVCWEVQEASMSGCKRGAGPDTGVVFRGDGQDVEGRISCTVWLPADIKSLPTATTLCKRDGAPWARRQV